jgi:hypothetical protein
MLDVTFDASASHGKMCVDYTVMNEAVRDEFGIGAMDLDRAKAYFDAWVKGFPF